KANGGQCVVGQAPYDVCLFEDGLTTVQPDVYVVCDRSKFDKKKLNGAPDLVIEVLSPSTAAYDKTVKLDDYRMAGVKEMWLVDYENGRIMVHQFAGGEGWSEGTTEPDLVKIYGMNDKVPVGIYDSALEIDFAQIDAYVKSVVGE
ncbi:MAG: Uma2 family endonuclease, partial [Eubacterium sp.]|nr:Uma2 family endonuclease [Candidatus Colimonas fimequi]